MQYILQGEFDHALEDWREEQKESVSKWFACDFPLAIKSLERTIFVFTEHLLCARNESSPNSLLSPHCGLGCIALKPGMGDSSA